MGTEKKESLYKKNLAKLLLVAFAGSIIYGLAYFRLYYYDAYMETYNLTNTQMGTLGSAYGFLGLVSYFFGGVLADRFSPKWLMITSLIATGIGGFTHLFFTDYIVLVAIYALWGFTSLLTFWPALLKMIRSMANDDEQSKAYGTFEGARGVTNAAHMAIATAIFGAFAGKGVASLGIEWIIIFYSVAPILCGIAFIFLLKDPKKEGSEDQKPEKLKMSDVVKVLKMPSVWMMILIVFTSYTFNMSYFYITPYSTNVLGASAVLAAVLTVLAQYVRPVASVIAGFSADKIGKSRLIFIGFVAMCVAMGLILFVPNLGASVQVPVMIVACTIVYFAMYSNYGILFSLQVEGGIPMELAGVTIGIVSTIGYLPELLCPIVAGATLDKFEGVLGYKYYFTGMIVLGIIGAVTCLAWDKKYGQKARLAAKAEAAAKAEEAPKADAE